MTIQVEYTQICEDIFERQKVEDIFERQKEVLWIWNER